jgi:hypothetical protein
MIINNNITNVLEKFEDIEKKFHLDNHKINNINWWDFLRYLIYEELLVQLNLNGFRFFNENKIVTKKRRFKNILDFINKLIDYFFKAVSFKSPVWIKKYSIIIFGHPRRIFENNLYIDKFVDPFIEIFKNKVKFSVIENPLNSSHLQPAKTKNLYFGEIFIFLSKIFSKFFSTKLSQQEINFINKIDKEIYFKFGVKINLLSIIRELLPKYRAELLIYKIFFKIKKPKKIFLVNSAGYESMIEAAKFLKIKTYELQHGSPSRGKLNYDYSSGIKKSTFPDYFLSFGKILTNEIKFPIKSENIIEIGFPYLNQKLHQINNTFKKEDTLLVISQPFYSKNLRSFSIKLKKKLGDKIKILYKPHPLEILYKDTDYFYELKENNIQVIKDYNHDLYELLNKSKWVLGVSSTALYEAVAFKCKVFVLMEPGYERLLKLINLNFAHLVRSIEEIQNLMDKSSNNNTETLFYNDKNKTIKSLLSNM